VILPTIVDVAPSDVIAETDRLGGRRARDWCPCGDGPAQAATRRSGCSPPSL